MTNFDSRELRNVLGCFATGVTVITAAKGGENFGITVNSFSSVSLDPPLVLWSLDKQSQSYDIFSSAKHYNIHVLREDQKRLSDQFASASTNKFLEVDFFCDDNGIPTLKEHLALMKCQLVKTIEQGDHLIIIGKVLAAESNKNADPLIFCKGQYAQLKS